MCSDGKIYFVDFNFHRGLNNEIIVKELAVLNLCGNNGFHVIFSPSHLPSNLKEDIKPWNVKHLDVIPYDNGIAPYNTLDEYFDQLVQWDPEMIYVKGTEKRDFLVSRLKIDHIFDGDRHQYQKVSKYTVSDKVPNMVAILDMERDCSAPSLGVMRTLMFPAMSRLSGSCYHHSSANCALLNVKLLLQWYVLKIFRK